MKMAVTDESKVHAHGVDVRKVAVFNDKMMTAIGAESSVLGTLYRSCKFLEGQILEIQKSQTGLPRHETLLMNSDLKGMISRIIVVFQVEMQALVGVVHPENVLLLPQFKWAHHLLHAFSVNEKHAPSG